MNRVLAFLVVAGLGAVLAGCAAGTKPARRIVVTGKATIPNVKPGTVLSCKGGPTVTVPAGGGDAAAVKGPAPVSRLDLTRSANGVTISCARG